MPHLRRIAVLTLLAALLLGAPSFAQTVLTGATPGGAFYTIVVPPTWNGGLVIWNHGFSLSPVGPAPDLGPLQDLQLAEGYAVAASSYRQAGWAVFDTAEDLEELYQVFVNGVGTPNQVLLFGASLGGLVTVQAIEQADLGNVVGALSICGAVAGSRNWDAGIDVRLIYDAICKDVPGAFIPGGAMGLALAPPLTIDDVVVAMNACFAHDLPAAARTAAQQDRLDLFLEVAQIPQSFINTSLGFFAMFGQADLFYSPDKLGGMLGTGNRNVDYGNAFINAEIERVGATPAGRRLLRSNYTPSGNVGKVKIVSIHTDKDGLVIVENESEYAAKVPRRNLTTGIVVEPTPTHCGFSTSETIAAWETLRGWVAGDPQPSPLALAAMCLAVQPTFGGDCRFNPFFQIPDMDGRVRPRNPGKKAQKAAPGVKASVAPSPAAAAPRGKAPAKAAPGAPGKVAEPAAPTRAGTPAAFAETRPPVPRGRALDRRER